MDQSMRDVPRNMRKTGMLLFRDAFMEAVHNDKLMCVVHTAHAAEILLKARIAQEHPLLIFSQLPTLDEKSNDTLGLIELLEKGRTLSYSELPSRLWATTGIKIERLKQYQEFGKLRNQIIHLSTTNTEKAPDDLTLLYSLQLLDPLVESFWGRSVFDFIKNDYFYPYYSDLTLGFLEERIKKIHPIDERLRRLLGENSRENLEKIEILSQINNLDESQSNEVLTPTAEEYLKYQQENPPESDESASEIELIEHWDNFLNSF
ncbi:hypothetical protein VB620_03790 [Nodularia harveyana UHCC-0300]|uniref:Apea-like HEPN domain-containing protein n=1 Tax=Nodularia harveyana UHCC-0300 TaxID=2974287 RepID=A0ABU5UAC4_9CYAN|nr:hypothetical protein [Nodularia harveyana]MEA5580462.1 hypothetical protein [Nodularia harveyana UHCC-0300]